MNWHCTVASLGRRTRLWCCFQVAHGSVVARTGSSWCMQIMGHIPTSHFTRKDWCGESNQPIFQDIPRYTILISHKLLLSELLKIRSKNLLRDAFKIKKNRNKGHCPILAWHPPSLGTLGHKKMGHFGLKSDPLPPNKNWDIILHLLVIQKAFESLVFGPNQTKVQHQQNRYLANTLIKMFVINLLVNKILCAAFGAWPSRPPPSYPSMSHLNIMKNMGSGLDPLPPFGTMSHISVFFILKASLSQLFSSIPLLR